MCRKVSSLDLHATTRTAPANTWGSVRHHWPELTITVAGVIGLNILAQRYWEWEQDFFVSELCIASLTLVAPWLFAAARGWIDHLASPLEQAVTIDDQTAPQWLHMQVSGLLDRWSPIIVG